MEVGDKVVMRKQHPCKNDVFEIVRVGADIKIKCEKCQRVIMMDIGVFEKRLKKYL